MPTLQHPGKSGFTGRESTSAEHRPRPDSPAQRTKRELEDKVPGIKIISGTTADANNGRTFSDIGPRGAILSLWASGDDAGDTIALTVGDKQILVASEVNIENSADVIAVDRDQLLFNEIVPGGHIFIPIVATSEVQFLLSIRYL